MSDAKPNEATEPNAPTEPSGPAETNQPSFQPLQRTHQELLTAANRQIWMGLVWWALGAIGIAASLMSTSASVYYWFGGLIAAPFAWYRAFKFSRQAQAAGAPKANLKQRIPAVACAAFVLVSAFIVVPEYIHVNIPGIGTCYTEAKDGSSLPVACFAPDAKKRAVSFVTDPSECPAESDTYFEPDASESRYTCLVAIK